MSELFRLVLSSTLSASVLILALLALRPVLRNKLSRAWQYYLWIIVLLRLAVPLTPSLGLTGWLFRDGGSQPAPQAIVLPSAMVPPSESPDTAPVSVSGAPVYSGWAAVDSGIASPETVSTSAAAPAAGTQVLNTSERTPVVADPLQTAGVVWLAGAGAVFLVRTARYVAFARRIKKEARPAGNGEISCVLAQIAADPGLYKTPALYISTAVGSPMLLGLFRPVIYLPDNAANGASLSYVLRHELTHLKRLDILYKWFNELVFCMHWFNPLVYLMTRRIERDCELSCDEAVANRLDKAGKMAYGKAVLDTAELRAQGRLLSAGLRGDKANIKERLGTILKKRKKINISLRRRPGAGVRPHSGRHPPGRMRGGQYDSGDEAPQPVTVAGKQPDSHGGRRGNLQPGGICQPG